MTHDFAPFPPRQSMAVEETDPARVDGRGGDPMLIDCDACSGRGIGCGDCVVTVLLGGPPIGVTLNEEERRAVEILSAAGLVPPLRLVHGVESVVVDPA